MGDTIGIFVFTPLVLTWYRNIREFQIKSLLDRKLLLITFSLIIVSYFTFIESQPVEYLLLPPLLWSAFSLGSKITNYFISCNYVHVSRHCY
ncbi:hypothetical protein FJR05_14655 [Dolichospermum sp. UHCC 0259]|nr:hypothetical protein [Dolichospermum sp. UHCC 0259]